MDTRAVAFGAASAPDRLALVLGYACQSRCAYCPLDKTGEALSVAHLEKALAWAREARWAVRLSGAEPLLHSDSLRRVLEGTPGLSVRLTTNGLALNAEWLRLFAAHPGLELALSLDGAPATQLVQRGHEAAWLAPLRPTLRAFPRPITVNLVVSPACAAQLVENVAFVWRQGLFRLNLLPAYYVAWPDAALAELDAQLRRLASLVVRGLERGWPLRFANFSRLSAQALFADAWVVDADGYLYDNEWVTHRLLRAERRRYALASLDTLAEWHDLASLPRPSWPLSLFPADVLHSTHAADACLGRFLAALAPVAAELAED